eukprot:982547-Pelagomonas_calceolata.AAC.3
MDHVCAGTLLSHNAYGQKNKVPQEAIPEEVARKVGFGAIPLVSTTTTMMMISTSSGPLAK